MDWDLVVFDCDGVLVDTEPVANRLVAEALTEAGLPTAPGEALEAFLGGKLAQIAAEAEARLGRALPEGWVARVYERQFEVFRRGLDPIPGVVAALDEIEAAGVPVCVGSNGPPEKMEVTLGASGLLERFAGRVFSADHVGAPKPAPDLYLHCAARMGADPARCVVVEDSPRGAAAGVAAGMMVFGYAAAAGREKLRAAGCKAVFDDMARVPSLLRVAAGARARGAF